MSVFIFSIAVGSFVVGKLKNIRKQTLFINQILITVSLLLLYLTIDQWSYFSHLIRISFQPNMAGFWGYYASIFLILCIFLTVPIGLMGATVPIAFHELKHNFSNIGKDSGFIFSWNTFGNLVGSLIGGIVFYYFFNNFRVFLIAAFFVSLSAIFAGWHLSKKKKVLAFSILILISISIILKPFQHENNFALGTFRILQPFSYSFSGPTAFFKEFLASSNVIFYKDGPTATVAVVEDKNESIIFNKKPRAIIVNGKCDSSTENDMPMLKLAAHLPALLAKDRTNALVIGLGTGVTAGELTLYPDIERIDIAEISPTVVDVLPLFGDFTNNVHKDPRINIHIGDAFRVLGRSSQKWDIISSEPSNPWVTGVDLLYTTEFYKLANEHLSDNGILAQFIHNYSSSIPMVGMVVNSVMKEFKQTRVFMVNHSDLIILGTNKTFTSSDLQQSQKWLENSNQVKNSLSEININSIDALLLREIWPPSYIKDKFSAFGFQTMDNPRLHYLAGKNFFIDSNVPVKALFNESSAPYHQDFLMATRHSNWNNFTFPSDLLIPILDSLKDKRTKNSLPMHDALTFKSFMNDSTHFSIPDELKVRFQIDLIPLITKYP